MSKLIKTILPLLLVLTLAFSALTPSLASRNEASLLATTSQEASASKEEVVYANLSNDGSVKSVYVVNIFESDEGGIIKDKGDYESVLNLTDTSEIRLVDNELSFSMSPGRFYYQGNMKSLLLPWDFDIGYYLDGAPISADDIGGKSGALEITISTGDSAYSDKAFFENYMLQVSLTLDTSKCRNISANGATVANAGKDKIINFTVMPGNSGVLKVSAVVVDFEMQAIQITGIPLSLNIDLPDTGSLAEELSPLSDAIRQLNNGTSQLSAGIEEIKYGFSEYTNGLSELRGGSAGFLAGLKMITEQNSALTSGSAAILEGLRTLSTSLETGEFSGLGQLSELTGALSQLSEAVDRAAAGLKELETNYSQGYAAISAAIDALPQEAIDDSVLAALSVSTDPNVLTLLSAYQGQYEAIMRLNATFSSLRSLFDGLAPALSQSASGLSEVSLTLQNISAALKSSLTGSDLSESVGGLKSGVNLLLANYEEFHQGITAYTGGLKELEAGYVAFDGGMGGLYDGGAEILNGLNGLSGGASELSDGTDELYRQTSDMDSLISDKLEELVSGYDKSDYVATSFVTQGRELSSVQFVFKTEGIVGPEPEAPPAAIEEKPTFWNRLLSLFGL